VIPSLIKDITLASKGETQVDWAYRNMPIFHVLYDEFGGSDILKDVNISLCLHVTKETGVFVRFLHDLGANVSLAASNPLSTQDDVAAYLASIGVNVFAWRGETDEEYHEMLNQVLDIEPMIVVDDGGDLHTLVHRRRKDLFASIIGGTEETTTGVIRLKAMEREGVLGYPVIAVNDTPTKRIFDNKYGSGQSTIDGIMRATSILLAGKVVVVSGYGYVGKGVALRARGMGARVIVTEVDPVKAIEAYLDGYDIMPMSEACRIGDIFITCTGMKDVIRGKHIKMMKDGAILANSGHFNVEINLGELSSLSKSKRRVREHVDEYILEDGKRIYLLGEGRLINLVAAEGHPPDIMMNSFANQFFSILYLLDRGGELDKKVYRVPEEIDEKVARYTLRGWGIEIDELSEEQRRYGESWLI
jgi:adenosylhomocysteinase